MLVAVKKFGHAMRCSFPHSPQPHRRHGHSLLGLIRRRNSEAMSRSTLVMQNLEGETAVN